MKLDTCIIWNDTFNNSNDDSKASFKKISRLIHHVYKNAMVRSNCAMMFRYETLVEKHAL